MEASMNTTDNKTLSLNDQFSNDRTINPLDVLPEEISLEIFSKLQPTDLGRCGLVSKQWEVLANDESLWKAMEKPANAFGAKQWAEHFFGIIVDEPPLPLNIHKILKSQCPFSEKGKKVEDTHVLVLIPGSFNGKPLTLKTFGEHVHLRYPELGQNGYRCLWDAAGECGGNGKSHWVLMTKDVLSESRNKSFAAQQKKVEEGGQGNYQVPEALDVVVCAISEYARSGGATRLLNDKPRTYTRCQDKIEGYQIVVGGFASAGLDVFCHNSDNDFIGVGALRKFF